MFGLQDIWSRLFLACGSTFDPDPEAKRKVEHIMRQWVWHIIYSTLLDYGLREMLSRTPQVCLRLGLSVLTSQGSKQGVK